MHGWEVGNIIDGCIMYFDFAITEYRNFPTNTIITSIDEKFKRATDVKST